MADALIVRTAIQNDALRRHGQGRAPAAEELPW